MSENLSSFHRPGIASTGTALLTGTPSSDVVKVNSGEKDVLEHGYLERAKVIISSSVIEIPQ